MTTTKKKLGRPFKHDWNAKRSELETLIGIGYTREALAGMYGITEAGMRKVLNRMGLLTQGQVRAKARGW